MLRDNPRVMHSSTRPRLSRDWLAATGSLAPRLTAGSPTKWPERVIQFGEGNFLRAFADWMIDVANEQGVFDGRVVIVQPIRRGRSEWLNEQDGLYTVITRGLTGGREVDERRIVTAVSRAIDPYEAWDELASAFCQPSIRFVISNTTEAGIADAEEPLEPGRCPDSFPAKLAALMQARFVASGASAESGLIVLPCELIERNGRTLRDLVLQHGRRWGFGEAFAHWVLDSNRFLDTLVDRIVPGYPGEEAERLGEELGYDDRLMVAAEPFHFWAIEGDAAVARELPLAEAGLDVVWTDDLGPYRTRKVRILNGAHTASVLAAFHGGLDQVQDMMADPVFGEFVRRVVFEEILPATGRASQWEPFAVSVLERFRNRSVQHRLLTISLNSVSKWRVRILPSMTDYLKARGSVPVLLSHSLAALLFFYRGRLDPSGTLVGQRDGETYIVRDEPSVLARFDRAWASFERHSSPEALVAELLGEPALWGSDLMAIPGLAQRVSSLLTLFLCDGARDATARLLR